MTSNYFIMRVRQIIISTTKNYNNSGFIWIGMLTTGDKAIWERAWSYKDHGKSHEKVAAQDASPEFSWLHDSLGTNWRMTEIQAAIGRLQLRKLPGWVERRRRFASILNERFGAIPALRVTEPPAGIGHAYYKYYVFVRTEALKAGWGHDRIVRSIVAEGVPCYSGICSEVYLEQGFDGFPSRPEARLPVAKQLGESSLMLLVHPTLSEDDIDDTAMAVEKVMAAASR